MGSRSLYVIGVTTNPVKIGIADSVSRRLITLQIGCPDPLVLHHQIRVPQYLAPDIEAAAHRKLRAQHRHGEWFNVDADQARDVIVELSERLRTDEHRKATRRRDILDELEVEFDMNFWARSAVAAYRSLASRPDGKLIAKKINSLILAETGMAAYTVFQMVVADQSALPAAVLNTPGAVRNAHAALAKAINVLAEHYARTREKVFAD